MTRVDNGTIAEYISRPIGSLAELVRLQARARPDRVAVICNEQQITYHDLDSRIDRVAARLISDGAGQGDVVAICAASSIDYIAVFLGVLRTGAAISPLSPSSTPAQLLAMLRDSKATHIFTDKAVDQHLAPVSAGITARRVNLESGDYATSFEAWLAPPDVTVPPVEIKPEQPFNIIYSSGTTGTPKGIIQSFRMRWPHNHLANPPGYGPDAIAIISTGLYSNTTLVSLIPALAGGGTVVLMPKFDARQFLVLCERHRVSFAMLVPVQYQRILAVPDFDAFDLSSFYMKYATSAPFPAELKAQVLLRWPGGLTEYYGMTEGGGSCVLLAHEHPDKLSTVGRPMPGHDIRVVDTNGNELPPGHVGEVVGKSGAMMNGYHNRPEQTAEAEWISPKGERFIRTGDLAMVDDDGFFTLMGRRKEMIISGGINIYPSDLEAALLSHSAVHEAAVIGLPSSEWGETPVGFVTIKGEGIVDPDTIKSFANAQLGKMQRLSAVRIIKEMPRNGIGKIVKSKL